MECFRFDCFDDSNSYSITMTRTRRVDCTTSEYDVYMGRGRCPRTGKVSIWGNPYSVHLHSAAKFVVSTRDESIILHKVWLRQQPELLARLCELKGKALGCWCKSYEKCHVDNIIELIDELCV